MTASRRAIGESVGSLLLDTMPDNPNAAMRESRSEFLDGAFETPHRSHLAMAVVLLFSPTNRASGDRFRLKSRAFG